MDNGVVLLRRADLEPDSAQPFSGCQLGLRDVPVVIPLTSEGHLFLNDTPIPDGGLPSALGGEARDSAVVVRADKVTVLEKFVALVDEVRGLGFQQVSLEVIRL